MSTRTTVPQPKDKQFPGNSSLEKALETIVNVYHQYSIRRAHLDLLNFNEFQTLLKEQAPNFLSVCVSIPGVGRIAELVLGVCWWDWGANIPEGLWSIRPSAAMHCGTSRAHRMA